MFKAKKMRETILAYSRLFDTPDGKKVLADLCSSCHILESTLDKTPHETYFNEGARSVVLRILKTIGTDVGSLDKFIEEIQEKEEQYE